MVQKENFLSNFNNISSVATMSLERHICGSRATHTRRVAEQTG